MDVAINPALIVGAVAIVGMILISLAWWIALKKNEKQTEQYRVMAQDNQNVIRENKEAMVELVGILKILHERMEV